MNPLRLNLKILKIKIKMNKNIKIEKIFFKISGGIALIVLNCTTESALHLGLVGQSSSASAVQFLTPHLSMLPRSVCTAASLTTADRSTLSYRNEVLQGSKVMVMAAKVGLVGSLMTIDSPGEHGVS